MQSGCDMQRGRGMHMLGEAEGVAYLGKSDRRCTYTLSGVNGLPACGCMKRVSCRYMVWHALGAEGFFRMNRVT
jgi:hypothetical protein